MSDSFSWWGVLSAVGVLTGLGITFGALLGMASARFKGEENPLVEKIDALLPKRTCASPGFGSSLGSLPTAPVTLELLLS